MNTQNVKPSTHACPFFFPLSDSTHDKVSTNYQGEYVRDGFVGQGHHGYYIDYIQPRYDKKIVRDEQ